MAKATPHLVWKHLERINARIFEEYREVITATVAITGRLTNGWQFWMCERGKGNWVRMKEMKG